MQKLLFIIGWTVSSLGFSQSFKTVKVSEENIRLKIPKYFINMSDQDRIRQIYSSKVPLSTYTNENKDIVLGINYNVTQWTNNDTEFMYGFYKASLQNLFDEIVFIQDGIQTINGREFIVFEFVGVITDDNVFGDRKSQKNYTYIQYTSWKDHVLLFNLSCKERFKDQYQEIAKTIMMSINIK